MTGEDGEELSHRTARRALIELFGPQRAKQAFVSEGFMPSPLEDALSIIWHTLTGSSDLPVLAWIGSKDGLLVPKEKIVSAEKQQAVRSALNITPSEEVIMSVTNMNDTGGSYNILCHEDGHDILEVFVAIATSHRLAALYWSAPID